MAGKKRRPASREPGRAPRVSRGKKARKTRAEPEEEEEEEEKEEEEEEEEECGSDCGCDIVMETQRTPAELLTITHPPASSKARPATTDEIAFVKRPADLQKITSDKVQLAVWRRAAAPEFVSALSAPSVGAEGLPEFKGLVEAECAGEMLRSELCSGPYPLRSKKKRALTDDGLDELIDEIDTLVQVFAEITESEDVWVRLEIIEDNGCAFWHQDSVPFRLVATYRGPCTEWVPPDLSNATLRRRQFDSEHAQALTHHDVALFKGRGQTFEGGTLLNHPGIVHRSPRTEGSGVVRVVLVLDIPQPWHFETE